MSSLPARSPAPRFDQPLPINALLDPLRAALRVGHALFQAPTGSGKSTRVPLAGGPG